MLPKYSRQTQLRMPDLLLESKERSIKTPRDRWSFTYLKMWRLQQAAARRLRVRARKGVMDKPVGPNPLAGKVYLLRAAYNWRRSQRFGDSSAEVPSQASPYSPGLNGGQSSPSGLITRFVQQVRLTVQHRFMAILQSPLIVRGELCLICSGAHHVWDCYRAFDRLVELEEEHIVRARARMVDVATTRADAYDDAMRIAVSFQRIQSERTIRFAGLARLAAGLVRYGLKATVLGNGLSLLGHARMADDIYYVASGTRIVPTAPSWKILTHRLMANACLIEFREQELRRLAKRHLRVETPKPIRERELPVSLPNKAPEAIVDTTKCRPSAHVPAGSTWYPLRGSTEFSSYFVLTCDPADAVSMDLTALGWDLSSDETFSDTLFAFGQKWQDASLEIVRMDALLSRKGFLNPGHFLLAKETQTEIQAIASRSLNELIRNLSSANRLVRFELVLIDGCVPMGTQFTCQKCKRSALPRITIAARWKETVQPSKPLIHIPVRETLKRWFG